MRATSWARRLVVAPLGALLLVLVVAWPVGAITWETPSQVSSGGLSAAWRGSLVATGASSAVVTDRDSTPDPAAIFTRHTTDGGDTWSTPYHLSTAGVERVDHASLAAAGQTVDAIWSEGTDCFFGPCVLHYARSVNGANSFGASKALSGAAGLALTSQVVRSGTLVVVAWTDGLTGKIWSRVSVNGGTSFKAAKLIATTTNGQAYFRDGYVSVAIGTGVIQLAYLQNGTTLRLRRSTDKGTTWKTAQTLASNAFHGSTPSMAASGGRTVITWVARAGAKYWIAARRSTDKGAHWATAVKVTPQSTAQVDSPTLAVAGSMWRVAYMRCAAACATASKSVVYLRASTNGGSAWGAASRVSRAEDGVANPVGVAYAGLVLVAYSAFTQPTPDTILAKVYVCEGS